MTDIIQGTVIDVIDGDTLIMRVTKCDANNTHKYEDTEKIRITNFDAPELNTPAGQAAKKRLSRLIGKKLECHIEARDTYGRIVAKIKPRKS